MQRLEYVCSTGGSISFEGPIYGETMPSLRGRAWTYTLGARTLTGVAWQARELTLTVKAVDGETQLDRLRMLTDHDVLAHSRDSTISGLLRVDDVWECRALITKSRTPSSTLAGTRIRVLRVIFFVSPAKTLPPGNTCGGRPSVLTMPLGFDIIKK